MHANFGEPGFEHNETLDTGCNAAVKGGFTKGLSQPKVRVISQADIDAHNSGERPLGEEEKQNVFFKKPERFLNQYEYQENFKINELIFFVWDYRTVGILFWHLKYTSAFGFASWCDCTKSVDEGANGRTKDRTDGRAGGRTGV